MNTVIFIDKYKFVFNKIRYKSGYEQVPDEKYIIYINYSII